MLTSLCLILKKIVRDATFLRFSSVGRLSLENMAETLLVKQ